MNTSPEASQESGTPADWAWELQRRCELATPQDAIRGLFINSMLESIRVLGDETAAARCQEVLGGQTFVAFFNYPITVLLRLTGAAMRELSGHCGGPENAARTLGRKANADFMASTLGNAVRMMSGKDIKLFLGSVHTIFRLGMSHGERRVEWYGPRSGVITVQRNFMPVPYHEGALEGLFTRYDLKGVRVRGQQTGPLDSAYEFSWE